MTRLNLPYIDTFRDRHGKVRFYFRRPGGKRVPLPGPMGSPEFLEAYQIAAAGMQPAKGRRRTVPGTFDALAVSYFASPDYLMRLKPSTRGEYRRSIEALMREIGPRPVAGMKRDHVQKLLAKRAQTPGTAHNALKVLRILLRFAIEAGQRVDDPTMRIRAFRLGEHHTWTDEEIGTFEARWPLGTRERTAFALLLYTGQRVGDVARMSWRDLAGGAFAVTQGKTGTELRIPLHPELARALAVGPREHMSIVTWQGRPYTSHGLGNLIDKAADAAGLPARCVPHGLRKAAARRLAEAGCSTNEIAAITGHASLREVERYTRAADQHRLASAAVLKWEKRK
jgi:integrase